MSNLEKQSTGEVWAHAEMASTFMRELEVGSLVMNVLAPWLSDKTFTLQANYLAISNHRFKVCFLNYGLRGQAGSTYWSQSQVCCIQCETLKANSPDELHAPGTCIKITHFLMHWEMEFYTHLLTETRPWKLIIAAKHGRGAVVRGRVAHFNMALSGLKAGNPQAI